MDKLQELGELAFGSRLKRLSDLLMKDVKKIYKHLEIDFEPTLMPVFKTIADETEASIGDLSKFLDISQPAITQFIQKLKAQHLVSVVSDKIDKRKKKITLSKKGQHVLAKMQPIWNIIEDQVTSLTNNGPVSFMEQIRLTELSQKEYSLHRRIMDQLAQNIKIINFTDNLSTDFYHLNVEWLEKYFYVEPYDKKVLSNPIKYIINSGGYIFFAEYNGIIVGTVALINQNSFFELSKMAVSPKYQGLKIGQHLMNHCISFSKKQGWKSITLYSHKKLIPAINLYKKVGFKEVNLEKDSHYERSDIKMELTL